MHSFQSPRRLALEHRVQSISTNTQYVIFQKYFSHPSFSYLTFFPTPPIKLKLGLQAGQRLLTANPCTNQTIYPIRNTEQSINTIWDTKDIKPRLHMDDIPRTLNWQWVLLYVYYICNSLSHTLGYPAVNLRSHTIGYHALGYHAVNLRYAIYIMQKSSYVKKKE